MSVINVEYKGRVAIITIDNEKKLGALNQGQYYELATKLNEVAGHDEVYVTVLIGKGRFFSATPSSPKAPAILAATSSKKSLTLEISGADVTSALAGPQDGDNTPQHRHLLNTFLVNNLNLTRAFYTHPKVLVAALNGPVIGLSAAIVSLADFIYATPSTFLLTPFASLGLVAEGVASKALVKRLGPAKANEALLMSKKITIDALQQCGYVNEVFDVGTGPGADLRFRERVLKEIDDRLGDHLVGDSLLGIKKLLRDPEIKELDVQNVAEVFAGVDRLMKGIPQEEFRKIARGEKRHKL
ncbi:hypothetical protein jhhlp_004665 [Lomentospora prolificans]|uniref:Uncharacterized protein n=1 Tax=Lomentospora prolificans TaxID=41688 RepID=A0A2N3NC73_9PEZI|nr:hypothetical protein jhhlp_004665 [Lomentospora prolificans]